MIPPRHGNKLSLGRMADFQLARPDSIPHRALTPVVQFIPPTGGPQAFRRRKAARLRNTIRLDVGRAMADWFSSCVSVRETVSMVSPR
jgi:hypothetical protein